MGDYSSIGKFFIFFVRATVVLFFLLLIALGVIGYLYFFKK